MKPKLALPFLLLTLLLVSAPAFGQDASEAQTVSPEDLGIHKYVFKTTPPKGYVAVFRWEEYEGGKLVFRHETIANTPGVEFTKSVLFFDSELLTGSDTNYILNPSTIHRFRLNTLMKFSHLQRKPPLLKIVIAINPLGKQSEAKERTFDYSISNEPYADVMRRLSKALDEGVIYEYLSDIGKDKQAK